MSESSKPLCINCLNNFPQVHIEHKVTLCSYCLNQQQYTYANWYYDLKSTFKVGLIISILKYGPYATKQIYK